MNDAVWALPGLMPPKQTKYDLVIITNEDGSWSKEIYKGIPGAVITYAIWIPGWYHGVIKDPNYDYSKTPPAIENYPYYLTTIVEGATQTSTLNLPANTLPEGTSIVSVCINGVVSKYYVTRPAYAIHEYGFNASLRAPKRKIDIGVEQTLVIQAMTPCTLTISLLASNGTPYTSLQVLPASAKAKKSETTEWIDLQTELIEPATLKVMFPEFTMGLGKYDIKLGETTIMAGTLVVANLADSDAYTMELTLD